ncbi:hypothetical protein CBM2609_P170004 [Cupriavidus taiwanensis]|nr:hypothetical protein CBM2604_P180004 [Cupriavidus taiwanensis]SOZ33860.1 hypothetical protein CBM2609_P170004 [Cupriavidus taiwanensis]SOZ50428.1 hypothetical protein CBM2610_P160004 [Cupriavidus taiwanensis]
MRHSWGALAGRVPGASYCRTPDRPPFDRPQVLWVMAMRCDARLDEFKGAAIALRTTGQSKMTRG